MSEDDRGGQRKAEDVGLLDIQDTLELFMQPLRRYVPNCTTSLNLLPL